ncbi:MAG: hypothetical protein ABSH25_12215, partial [Syntrophorhabdales bacterium]
VQVPQRAHGREESLLDVGRGPCIAMRDQARFPKGAPAEPRSERRRPLRSGAGRWGAAQPHPGNWHILDLGSPEKDPIDEAELIKDRARQLFRRYGVLFRELLANELPLLQWPAIFRALRLMELSGECLSGHFFEGIPGIQFCSRSGSSTSPWPRREPTGCGPRTLHRYAGSGSIP